MCIIELVTFGEPNVEASSNSMLKLLRHSFDIMLEFILGLRVRVRKEIQKLKTHKN